MACGGLQVGGASGPVESPVFVEWSERRQVVDPLAWVGVLAIVIGVIGVLLLVRGRKKKTP